MKSIIKKIQLILYLLIGITAFGQRDQKAVQIRNDPDWKIILNNNVDFLNRLLKQEKTLAEIWSDGRGNIPEQLGYAEGEYLQKHAEVRAAASRLLIKYPELNSVSCQNCKLTGAEMIGRTDNFINYLKRGNNFDSGEFFQVIEDDEEGSPQCSWKFYACITICAATIEFFPAYLACCGLCLCEYCKNPPSWCN
ncbi:MAG TPA: hypothetical protein VGD17_03965 [Chitinophagaceae bacterium]